MGNSVKILIGTDLFFYEKLVRQITNPDYKISEFNNLSELFQTCNDYQLIILDLNDPALGGINTISKLKEVYTGKTIAFAGHVQKKLLNQAKDLGIETIAVNSEISVSIQKIIETTLAE